VRGTGLFEVVKAVGTSAAAIVLVLAVSPRLGGSSSDARDVELPPVGPVTDSLARPLEVVTEDGAYRFTYVHRHNGSPVRYDPCQPIPLVINPAGGPPEGNALIQEAVDEVAEASRLNLLVLGPTAERPRSNLSSSPGTWPPSLIVWSDPAESPRLEESLGFGGSGYIGTPGAEHYATGQVVLDGPELSAELPDNPDFVRGVVMHELAHLLGLNHVSDPTQLMYAGANDVHSLQGGDRTGLAALGSAPCNR